MEHVKGKMVGIIVEQGQGFYTWIMFSLGRRVGIFVCEEGRDIFSMGVESRRKGYSVFFRSNKARRFLLY